MTQTNHRASSPKVPTRRTTATTALRQPHDAGQGFNLDRRRATGVAVLAAHKHVDHGRDCVAAECAARAPTAKTFRQGRRRARCGPSPTDTSPAAATISAAIFRATHATTTNTPTPKTRGTGRRWFYYPNKEDIGPVIKDGYRCRPRREPRGPVRSVPRKRQPASSRQPSVSGECQPHSRYEHQSCTSPQLHRRTSPMAREPVRARKSSTSGQQAPSWPSPAVPVPGEPASVARSRPSIPRKCATVSSRRHPTPRPCPPHSRVHRGASAVDRHPIQTRQVAHASDGGHHHEMEFSP